MTRVQSFPLPDVGEGLTEAEILEWKVAEGDMLEVNQIMVEIETAKAAVELPSPHAGKVHRLLAEPGGTIEVGTPIIEIDTQPDAGPLEDDSGGSGGGAAGAGAGASGGSGGGPGAGESGAGESGAGESGAGSADGTGGADGPEEAGTKIGESRADGSMATLVGVIPAEKAAARRPRRSRTADFSGGSAGGGDQDRATVAPLSTPPVRKLAKDLGVDLHTVTATRADGVIGRSDVEAAHAGTSSLAAGVGANDARVAGGAGAGAPLAYDPATRETRVPVKGVRKATAEAMVESAFTAPHVTEMLTIDVTPMMELKDRLRASREWADVTLSPLAFAARAVCLAARRTPEANCLLDTETGEIVYKSYVHLGIAAATDRGLVVPVVRDADRLDLRGLAVAIGKLAAIARAGKTPPADMLGGTISITNVGVFGVDTGTPIIPPGQSAILALGSIKDAPWVVDGELTVRKVCPLALSFDHRVIDGQQGSEFLANVGALLSDPAVAITY